MSPHSPRRPPPSALRAGRAAVFPLLLLFAGACHKPPPAPAVEGDPLEALRAPPGPFTYQGTLSLQVIAPAWGVAGSTPATLVLRRPDRLYMQVRGPIGGLLLEAAANPQGLDLLLPSRSLLLHSDDPDRAIRDLTRGALDLDGLLALLTARLPREPMEVRSADRSADGWRYVLEAPEGYSVTVDLADRGATLSRLALADPQGETVVTVAWADRLRAGRERLPEDMAIEVPPLDLSLEARFRAWTARGETRGVFEIHAPDRMEPRDLEQALAELAAPSPDTDKEPEPDPGPETESAPDPAPESGSATPSP